MNEILKILERKLELLSLISQDIDEQRHNIEVEDLDAIEYIINRRTRFMEEIETLNEKIDGEYEDEILNEKLKSINSLVRDILKRDKMNMIAMENLVEFNKEDLKQVKDGIKINNAYYPPNTGSMMINQES